MATQIRRVVTGHDRNGKAVVLSDGPVPTVHSNPIRPGQLSFEVWKTGASPIPLAADESEPTAGPRSLQPPPAGTVFRISVVPPESEETRKLTPEQANELFRKSGAGEASTFGRGGRHPMMHRTETVDYAVVLDGEITLLLDEGDVVLKTGDVVIQRGTNHAWSNRSGKPVKMLYVLMDARFDPGLAAQFKQLARGK
ncbi:MAG: cupin domain-containing protein [Betaproteobacteria bacterium]|nr:cupin domain-containing protein [Betaproteobacteria bacterium]MBI2509233.1 cupin domain-containing protein [Betaproteobacteria bacterium]